MNKFELFTPVKKFYYTPEKVIFLIFAVGILPVIFEWILFENKTPSKISFSFALASFAAIIVGRFMSLFNATKYETLKGVIQGNIVFESGRIIVDAGIYLLSDVNKINFITYNDYIGRLKEGSSRSFNGRLSQGVDNKFEIEFLNGEKLVYYFLLLRRYQLRDIKEQLVDYYKAGKLDFENLILILGLENYNAVQNFKNSLLTAKNGEEI